MKGSEKNERYRESERQSRIKIYLMKKKKKKKM